MVSTAEAMRFRRGLIDVSKMAQKDMQKLIRKVDLSRGVAARDDLVEVFEPLAREYADLSGAVAAEWFEDVRLADGVDTPFTADIASLDDYQVKSTAYSAGAPLVEGGLTTDAANLYVWGINKLVMGAASGTILENTQADREARGWQRIARANGCDFCVMLTGHGGVYLSERTATFAAHDHCRCTAAPSWDSSAKEVPVRCYEASERMDSVRRRAAGNASDTDIVNARRGTGKKLSAEVTQAERTRDQIQAQRILDDHRRRVKDFLADEEYISSVRESLAKQQGVKLAV